MITTQQLAEKSKLNPELLQELYRLDRHPRQLMFFIMLYGAAAAFELSQTIATPWVYIACLPFYLLSAASLHGISLFAHEGVHETLSWNASWNRILSILCAPPILQNYSAYRVLHLQHHQNLGASGDPDHYKNHTSWNGLLFLMSWGRLLIGYPIYITAISVLGFQQGKRTKRTWMISEGMCLGLVIAFVLLLHLPKMFLVQSWLVPMLLINVMVNICGMRHHTLLEHEAGTTQGTRTILTNPLTYFFMCTKNYHLEHHLYPHVSWYNLPRLNQAIHTELISQEAPYIRSHWSFVQDFIAASFQSKTVGTITIHS